MNDVELRDLYEQQVKAVAANTYMVFEKSPTHHYERMTHLTVKFWGDTEEDRWGGQGRTYWEEDSIVGQVRAWRRALADARLLTPERFSDD